MPNWFTIGIIDPDYDVASATISYNFPFSICAVCSSNRAFSGVNYPQIDPSRVYDKTTLKSLKQNRKAPWPEFLKLREALSSHLPPKSIVVPGIGFGEMTVKVKKDFEGFALTDIGLVISSDLLEQLKAYGITLETTPVKSIFLNKPPGTKTTNHFVQPPPAGETPLDTGVVICPECLRPSKPKSPTDPDILIEESAHSTELLFQLAFDPGTIAFHEDLVHVLVEKLKLKLVGLKLFPLTQV